MGEVGRSALVAAGVDLVTAMATGSSCQRAPEGRWVGITKRQHQSTRQVWKRGGWVDSGERSTLNTGQPKVAKVGAKRHPTWPTGYVPFSAAQAVAAVAAVEIEGVRSSGAPDKLWASQCYSARRVFTFVVFCLPISQP